MLGPILFVILVLLGSILLAVLIVTISDAIRRPGYICKNGHWQSSGENHCKKCGLPVKPYNNPKCSNGHEMKEGQEFCSKCGEKIAVREEQDPAQVAPEGEPQKEDPQQKHKTRNRVLAWILAFVFFGGLVWGATYFLQIVPLKEKVKCFDQLCEAYKKRIESEENKRRPLEHAKFSRNQAKNISGEKAVWKIMRWHIDEKGWKGTVWVKRIDNPDRYDREKEISLESHGLENWSDAFRWPGYVMIDFDYQDDWEETGDYLKPRLLKKE